jgi:hypothetical protein
VEIKNGIFFAVNGYPSKSVFMNHDFSRLNLTELYDQLSECTALYSRSMLNGFSEKEFAELRSLIEALQNEIEKRRSTKSANDDSTHLHPPQQPANA